MPKSKQTTIEERLEGILEGKYDVERVVLAQGMRFLAKELDRVEASIGLKIEDGGALIDQYHRTRT